jgi:Domain of unknown function (DUF5011)
VDALQTFNLKIGSADKPTGFTIYDKITKEPYCVTLENAEFVKTKGECVVVESTTPPSLGQSPTGEAAPLLNQGGNVGSNSSDTTPPVITLNGEAIINLPARNASGIVDAGGNVIDTYSELGATATDNVDKEIAIIISGSVNTSVAGVYTITYTAKDTAGNSAIPVIRTVNVGEVSSTTTNPSTSSGPSATIDTTTTITPQLKADQPPAETTPTPETTTPQSPAETTLPVTAPTPEPTLAPAPTSEPSATTDTTTTTTTTTNTTTTNTPTP